MILNYGDQEFVVDFENNFIQRHNCYLDGKNCLNCSEADECFEELSFIYEELECTNEKT